MSAMSQTKASTRHGQNLSFREYFETVRERPVYVVLGVQGSGTNLLGRILIRTFNFSLLRDRSMVFNAAVRLGTNPAAADIAREIGRFRTLVAPSKFDGVLGRKFIKQSEPFDGIFAELTPSAIRNGADFLRLIYAYRAYSLRMRDMAIKSDDIWEHINEIDTVLPNRRVILLTRDFRDNLMSIGGKHFGPIEPICAAQYVKQQFKLYDAEYRRSGVNGFHVKFETLVETPRRFIDDFARHYGLTPAVDPEAVLRTFHIRPNKIAKWKRLDAQDLAWCEGLLEGELRAYGYSPQTSAPVAPSKSVLFAAHVRDAFKRIPQKLRLIRARLGRLAGHSS